jgi:hypothetical protein
MVADTDGTNGLTPPRGGTRTRAEFEALVERMQHPLVRSACRRLHSLPMPRMWCRRSSAPSSIATAWRASPRWTRILPHGRQPLDGPAARTAREAPLADSPASAAPDPRVERWSASTPCRPPARPRSRGHPAARLATCRRDGRARQVATPREIEIPLRRNGSAGWCNPRRHAMNCSDVRLEMVIFDVRPKGRSRAPAISTSAPPAAP